MCNYWFCWDECNDISTDECDVHLITIIVMLYDLSCCILYGKKILLRIYLDFNIFSMVVFLCIFVIIVFIFTKEIQCLTWATQSSIRVFWAARITVVSCTSGRHFSVCKRSWYPVHRMCSLCCCRNGKHPGQKCSPSDCFYD